MEAYAKLGHSQDAFTQPDSHSTDGTTRRFLKDGSSFYSRDRVDKHRHSKDSHSHKGCNTHTPGRNVEVQHSHGRNSFPNEGLVSNAFSNSELSHSRLSHSQDGITSRDNSTDRLGQDDSSQDSHNKDDAAVTARDGSSKLEVDKEARLIDGFLKDGFKRGFLSSDHHRERRGTNSQHKEGHSKDGDTQEGRERSSSARLDSTR